MKAEVHPAMADIWLEVLPSARKSGIQGYLEAKRDGFKHLASWHREYVLDASARLRAARKATQK